MIINPIYPIFIVLIILLVCIFLIISSYRKKDIHITSLILRIIMVVMIFFINLRPMIQDGTSTAMTTDLDILFVIDTTTSMIAEDYNGDTSRFVRVKELGEQLVNEFAGSRFAILAFDNTTHVISPFTTDSNLIVNAIKSLNTIDYLYASGSTLDLPITYMEEFLESANEKEDRKQIVIFMSDGEQTTDTSINSFSSLAQYIDDGIVIGFGTSSGGKMKNNSEYSNTEYVMDYSEYPTKEAISVINEDNLKQIAEELGITYSHESELTNNYIKTKATSFSNDGLDYSTYSDIYWIFAICFMGCLFVEYCLIINKMKVVK